MSRQIDGQVWTRGLKIRYGGGLPRVQREQAAYTSVQNGLGFSTVSHILLASPLEGMHKGLRGGHFRPRSQEGKCSVGDCAGLHILPPDKAGNMKFTLLRGGIDQWLDPNPGDVFNAMMNYLRQNGIVPQGDAYQQCQDAFLEANNKLVNNFSEFHNPDLKQPNILQNAWFILPNVCRQPEQGKKIQSDSVHQRVPATSLPALSEGAVIIPASADHTVITPSHRELTDPNSWNPGEIVGTGVAFILAGYVLIRYLATRIFPQSPPNKPHVSSSPSGKGDNSNSSSGAPDAESSPPQPIPKPIIGNQDINDQADGVFAGARLPHMRAKEVVGNSKIATVYVQVDHPVSTAARLEELQKTPGAIENLLGHLGQAIGSSEVNVRYVDPEKK